MAIVERKATRLRAHLLVRPLVGRSPLAQLRLADPSVSAEHAVLGYNGRDDRPPTLLAWPEGADEPIAGEHDLLALPDIDAPEVTIYRDASGWVLEREGAREPLPAGAIVIAAGRRFTLHLPDLVARTVDAAPCGARRCSSSRAALGALRRRRRLGRGDERRAAPERRAGPERTARRTCVCRSKTVAGAC